MFDDRQPTDRKPIAGYPSQRQAILALHADGIDAKAIAARLDVPVNTVHARTCKVGARSAAPAAKPAQPRLPRAAEDRGGRPAAEVALNDDLMRELRPHAARRGMTVRALASALIDAVVDGKLVDAVLDDREG